MKRLPTHVRFKILCAVALLTIGIVMSIKNGSFIPILLGLVILLYELQSRTGAGGSEKGSRRAMPVR